MMAGRLYARAERLWTETQLGNENLDPLVTHKTLWSFSAFLALGLQRWVRGGHRSQVVQGLGGKTPPQADDSKAVWQVRSRPRDGEETFQMRAGAAGRARARFSARIWPTTAPYSRLQTALHPDCVSQPSERLSLVGEKNNKVLLWNTPSQIRGENLGWAPWHCEASVVLVLKAAQSPSFTLGQKRKL